MSAASTAVTEMLEYWHNESKKGELLFAGVVVAKHAEQVAYDYAGTRGFEDATRAALKTLDQELLGVLKSRRPGPRDYSLTANCVEYPLVCPLTWDFLPWLIEAEMTRRRLGAPAPLHVAFTLQEQAEKDRLPFFENVIRPMVNMLGAVEDVNAVGGRHKPFYTPMGIVNAAKGGEVVPKLYASAEAKATMGLWLHDTKPITITLREVLHHPQRNSNVEAWLKFAGDLQKLGENVIIIRDTRTANEALPGFTTAPIASYDTQFRKALYEHAKINFCVANGPGVLLTYSESPYLYFVNLKPGDSNDERMWAINHGISYGEQWPWASPTQRLVWQQDTYENLCTAWEQYGAVKG
jgi:hypothetical protein